MGLTEEEKDLVAQSLQMYVQQAAQQLPPTSVQQLLLIAKGIIQKLDTLDVNETKKKSELPPPGISQEWFDKVCQTCSFLTPAGACSDKITAKFPGKCDPILKYERTKAGVR